MSSSHVSIMSEKTIVNQKKSRRKSKHTDLIADFEQSELYELINEPIEESWIKSLDVINALPRSSLRQKSSITGNTYLHQVVLALSQLHDRNHGDLRVAIIVIYRLVLYGSDVNAQNELGNTCLHLTCFRPMGESVAAHLLRLGMWQLL